MPHPVCRDAKAELVRVGVTQKAVAAQVGKSLGYVSDCLNGRKNTPPAVRRAIAELTGRPEAELFEARP
jgi:transcriptional regulator with XRE-family HTH domain